MFSARTFKFSPFINCWELQNISRDSFKKGIDRHITTILMYQAAWCKRSGCSDVKCFSSPNTSIDDKVTRGFGGGGGTSVSLVLLSMELRADEDFSIMKIDLNWNPWHLNGWHRGIFLSRELGSQYGTYKRPINNVKPVYKTFTDQVNALYSSQFCSKICMRILWRKWSPAS